MRLLCLEYGADYVISEELIDQRIIRSSRIVNAELNTIDFVLPGGSVTFRTSAEEKNRVIVQLGTPEPGTALQAAKMLENDVMGIDVNMGCPKAYSIKGGMGAALLTKPEIVKDILTTLTTNLRIPVTCKMRILPELEKTIALAKLIESTGVAAITVHGRTINERSMHRNRNEVIQAIAHSVGIPVLANGGSRDIIRNHEDIEYFRQLTSATGVVIARAAMWNPAIFKSLQVDEPLPKLEEIICRYLTLSVRYDHHIAGAKYCVLRMLHDFGGTPIYEDVLASNELRDLCAIWNMLDVYDHEMSNRLERLKNHQLTLNNSTVNCNQEIISSPSLSVSSDSLSVPEKRPRVEEHLSNTTTVLVNDNNVPGVKINNFEEIVLSIPYERRFWPDHGTSPKQILREHCKLLKWDSPKYETIEDRNKRSFFSTVLVNGKRYRNTSACKSKRYAEQAAVLVCLHVLGIPDGKVHADENNKVNLNNK
ncbi:tRNA-dihydrouridine(20) synthase [NAD(P)+]-like [Schistosoma haematobium]|uniref:tRNA-dihydrouridine(20) synthase [NAD(P)+]-like n=1 Tax=Schistosoma haematobium TaxID=6185 RepID=A0A922IKJ2_SCHHA|nr:tRNA-dihydrouridine(20) synthase [NAD(P)+]-like [Schistosoma haematobium]KAH9581442.1 tRNA-dihydrouridine(20) synthase [NAD(P)+]-like [Schistosoma haematobium]